MILKIKEVLRRNREKTMDQNLLRPKFFLKNRGKEAKGGTKEHLSSTTYILFYNNKKRQTYKHRGTKI